MIQKIFTYIHPEKICTANMLQYMHCSHLNSLLMCSLEQKAVGFLVLFIMYNAAITEK